MLRCPREVLETLRMLITFFRPEVLGEYLSVTSQIMVESRNDQAENAWGLGWLRPSVTVVVVVVVIFYFSQDIFLSIDSPGQPFFYLKDHDQVTTMHH